MSTVRPEPGGKASSGGDAPNRRLPLRWAVIGFIAAAAGLANYPVSGPALTIITAVAAATGLHKMID
jgi:hypothetical protein